MDSSQLSRVITFGIQSHRSLEKQGRVQPTNFAAEKVLGKGAHKVFDEMPKPNFNSNSHRTLLVTVSNTIYPINETVLHQVFDSFGKVEMIHILPVKDDFQALLRFGHTWDARFALSSLHTRNIYDDCCRLDIQFITREFLDKCESYCAMCRDTLDAITLRSIFITLRFESCCSPLLPTNIGLPEKISPLVVSSPIHKEAKLSAKVGVTHDEFLVVENSTSIYPSRKIEFPVFDGNQPREWIRDCDEYFQIHSTSEKYKVTLAMTYMQGRTRRWRKCYDERTGEPTWPEFVAAILEEFEGCKSEMISLLPITCEKASELEKETEEKSEMLMTKSRETFPVIETKNGGFVMLKDVGSGVFDKVLVEAPEIRIENKENDEQLANEFEKIVVEPEGISVNGDMKTSLIGILAEGNLLENDDILNINESNVVSISHVACQKDSDDLFPHSFDPGGVGKSKLLVYSYFNFRRHVEFLRVYIALQIIQSLLVSRFERHKFLLMDKVVDIENIVKPVAGCHLGNHGVYHALSHWALMSRTFYVLAIQL